jgi:hypothetical protein
MNSKFFFVVIIGLIIYGLLGVYAGVGFTTKQSNLGLLAFTPAVWFVLNVIYYSLKSNLKKVN